MTINFNQIPSNIRVPLAYIEIDASNASQNLQRNTRVLVFGQRLSTGTIAASIPTLITSYGQAVQSFGQGSMLANMFKVLFDNNPYTEKWCVASDDNGSGTAASGTVTMTGTASAAGTLNLYIGGVLVQAAVAASDTVTTQATALAAAINANLDLPVTATSSSGVVTITYRHKGLVGNKLDMRMNYRGALGGEALPAGVAVAIVQMSGGLSDPTLSSEIAALPEQIFDFWLIPYIASGALNSFDTEMNSRWSPLRMLEGHVFTADSGTVSALVTLGNSRNNQYMTILDAGYNCPTPPYIFAAAMIGQIALSATIDPARPFTTLPMVDVLPMPLQNRRTLSEKNTLLYDGIATHLVTDSGDMLLERIVTCYQKNAFSVADSAWLDVNTPLTLSYLRQSLRARMTSKFARMKLADDGTIFGAGQAIVTPKVIRSEIIALAGEWQTLGLVEDMDQFKADLIVERDQTDPTRVNAQLRPNLVNQFYIFAAQISFIL